MTALRSRVSIAAALARRPVLAARRWIAMALVLAFALSACSSFKEGTEDSQRAAAAIKSEVGVDSTVSFRSLSSTKGAKLFVTVHLKSTPPGDAAAIKSKLTDIVNRNFRSHVDRVDVAL